MPSSDTSCPRPEESLPSWVTFKSLRVLRLVRISIHTRARNLDARDETQHDYSLPIIAGRTKGGIRPYENHVITKFQVIT
jgi:hypothetical protein